MDENLFENRHVSSVTPEGVDKVQPDSEALSEEQLGAFARSIPFAMKHFPDLFSDLDPHHPADQLVIAFLEKQQATI